MKLKSIILSLITLAILASCSTSNDVVNGRGIIQKRKYNDGFYISSGKNYNKKSDKVSSEKEALLSEETAEISTADKVHETENSVTPNNFSETSRTFEIDVPAAETDVLKEISKPETNGTISLSEPVNLITDQTETYKSGRVYSPKTILTKVSENSTADSSDTMLILLIILAFLLPWLAVGIFTSWDVLYTVLAVLLWFLAIVPGIIFALLVIFGVV